MTVLQRAATLAVMTIALAGLAGLSSPGQAAGLQAVQSAVPQASAAAIQPSTFSATLLVPVMGDDVQAAPAPITQPVLVPPAPVGFESLDAAVAAQDRAEVDPKNDEATRCLAAAIYFESKGEPVDGQLAVAEVIINRAKSGRFPDDVCSVVRQRGQFSFVRGGDIPVIDAGRAGYRTAVAVAKVAMAQAWRSSAPQALFFHARSEPMGGRVVRVAAIGNHVFYR